MLHRLHENIELVDIEAPEFIASSMYLLKENNWDIKHFNYENLIAEKILNNSQNNIFKINLKNNKAEIESISNLDIESARAELDSFINSYNEFLASQNFEEKVTELKYHYFMDNPIEYEEFENASNKISGKNKIFGFYQGHKVTSILLLLNFIVFVAMIATGVSMMMPETTEILKWGGNFRPLILDGQWWRLITCCFIHIGIIHILFNMWALFNIGIVIEPMIGSYKFAFAYIICGLAASLNSIVWHYATPSAGASGAIFGMFGLFAALLTTNLLEKGFRSAMLKSIMPMILLNLLLGTSSMIDNAGHIGGLVTGIVCGYLFAWHFKFPKNIAINILSYALPTLFIGFSIIAAGKNLPNPYKEYQLLLANINKYEINALELEKNANDIISLKKADEYWDKAIFDGNKILKLKLDKQSAEVNERLVFYLKLRKRELKYLANPLNAEQLTKTSHSIDSVLKIINEK